MYRNTRKDCCFQSYLHRYTLRSKKKLDHQTLMVVILSDLQNSFTVRLSDKFATKVIVKDPTTPYTRCYPCEICLQEIVMLKNCMNKTTTHAKFSDWKFLSKNTQLMMSALCNSLTRRYLPSNSQNNWLYAAATTKKKDFTAKSFRTSSTFSHSLWRC